MPAKIDDLLDYNSRCNNGHSDLKKALANSKTISKAQKKMIYDFWTPYLAGIKPKHAFDIRWFDVFNRTNVFGFDLAWFIPNGFYYGIIDPALTNARGAKVMDDKNLYDLYFYDVNQPRTIVRKINNVFMDENYTIIQKEEAIRKCVLNKNVIVKPSVNSLGGRGICFWKEGQDEKSLIKAIDSRSNLVVQDLIQQHESLARFTNSCVNTMRIVTLMLDDVVHVTTAVLIMGGAESKTNHLHAGGIVCGILPSGQLRDVAFDGKLNEYKVHPNGLRFGEQVIPNYDKCIELVKKLAPRLGGVAKLLNWDVTLDKDGNPMLVEVNLTWGGPVQIAGGPAFGDMTKKVLDYVKKNRTWNA